MDATEVAVNATQFLTLGGDQYGNCGYTQTNYIPCDSRWAISSFYSVHSYTCVISLSLYVCSDVNCRMLFRAANGQYQNTAGVSVIPVLVRTGNVECL